MLILISHVQFTKPMERAGRDVETAPVGNGNLIMIYTHFELLKFILSVPNVYNDDIAM